MLYNAPRRGAGSQVTSSTAERSPFPEKTEWRVKSGEWSWCPLRERDLLYRASVSFETSSTAKRSPFSYKEKALTRLKLR